MLHFFGLDFETSALDLTELVPIQVAIVGLTVPISIEKKLKFRLNQLAFKRIDREALNINGFTIEDFVDFDDNEDLLTKRPIDEADEDIVNQLESFQVEEGEIVPVGWNVGAFDLQIARRWLPETAKFFHHRHVDLNSVCYTIARGEEDIAAEIKENAKEYGEDLAKTRLSRFSPHDAEFDALSALFSWKFLQEDIHRGRS